MKNNPRLLILLLVAAMTLAAGGCSDDDDDPMAPATGETFTITIENVRDAQTHFLSGAFSVPDGETMPGPIGPGQAYVVTFGGAPGHKLSFATMMVQSNDLFYAPDGDGIELYDGDTPVTGVITDQLMLWDAGTEANEEPGLGMNQAPRQSGPDTGPADDDDTVRLVDDGYTYPAIDEVIEATLTYEGGGTFTLRIENVSTSDTLQPSEGPSLPVPMAPGVYVIHTESDPLFTAGTPEPGEGLEGLAEDGAAGPLADALAAISGLVTPLAPGAYAVHDAGMPIYTSGMAATAGHGLEELAEDGAADILGTFLGSLDDVSDSGVFSVPDGASSAGPAFPGDSYSFTVTAEPGDRLSLATMFVQSNDLFYGFADVGLALFSGDQPVTGDVTGQISLWDAGTEENQWPGAGPDQAPRQSGPDTGADDPNAQVRPVNDDFDYPATSDVVRVTITVQ